MGHHWIPKGICAGTHIVEHITNNLEKGINSETTEYGNDVKLCKAGCKE